MSNIVKYEMVPGVDVMSGDVVTAVHIRSEKKSMAGRVCKYCGFLSIAVILFFLILAAIGARAGVHFYHKVGSVVIPKLTVDAPLDLPTVFLTRSERKHLEKRLDHFHDFFHGKSSKRFKELVLTERELNGLICGEKEEMCGHVYATISENMVSADFSFPAGDMPGGKGRFFVGTKSLIIQDEAYYNIQSKITTGDINSSEEFPLANMTVHMDLDDGDLDVRITSAEVFGWMATDGFVHKFFDDTNWASNMKAHAKKHMKHIKGVTIGDGKIVLHSNDATDE
eukprot:scaffold29289_cov58-Attheya_sp.AAC.1